MKATTTLVVSACIFTALTGLSLAENQGTEEPSSDDKQMSTGQKIRLLGTTINALGAPVTTQGANTETVDHIQDNDKLFDELAKENEAQEQHERRLREKEEDIKLMNKAEYYKKMAIEREKQAAAEKASREAQAKAAAEHAARLAAQKKAEQDAREIEIEGRFGDRTKFNPFTTDSMTGPNRPMQPHFGY